MGPRLTGWQRRGGSARAGGAIPVPAAVGGRQAAGKDGGAPEGEDGQTLAGEPAGPGEPAAGGAGSGQPAAGGAGPGIPAADGAEPGQAEGDAARTVLDGDVLAPGEAAAGAAAAAEPGTGREPAGDPPASEIGGAVAGLGEAPADVAGQVPPPRALAGSARRPGALLARRGARPKRHAHRRRGHDEVAAWAFATVTIAPGLIVVAWLVIGLALLLAGRFTPIPMALIAVPVAVGLVVLTTGRPVSAHWPAAGLGRWPGRAPGRPWAAWWGLAGTAAIAGGFGAWQAWYTSPALIVDRAPGAATQYGYWIAEYGSLPISRSLAAFGGPHAGLAFSSFAFTAHGGGVSPRLAPGLPVLLSAGLWAHSLTAGALVAPILGAFAVLAVGGLTGRLAGPQWAPAGALLLALSLPEVYTSRSAFSEILAQTLLFCGLCLVVDCLGGGQSRALAGLGGLALGLVTTAQPTLAVTVLPAIPFVAVMAAGGRRQALPFGAGLLAGVAYGMCADLALAGPAAAAGLRPVGLAAVAFASATALGLILALAPAVRRAAPRWFAARPLRWLPDAAALAVAAGAVGLAVRPYLQTARGPADSYVAALQRAAYLVAAPGRTYAEDSLYWVIWYLGAPALVLGVAGLALAARRSVRALLAWSDGSGSARAWALPVAVFGWAAAVVLWHPGTVPDHPWASRRLVPVVLPGLVVCGVWVVSWLIRHARARGAGLPAMTAAVACFAVALGAPAAAATFGVGASWSGQPSLRPSPGGVALARVGAGEAAAIRKMCGAIPANASVLIVDESAARRFAQVIRGMCGIPVGVMAGASPAQVSAVISAVERAGRRPELLAATAGELARYGGTPGRVLDLATRQDAHVLTQPPASAWPVRYTLWMSAPGGPVPVIGA